MTIRPSLSARMFMDARLTATAKIATDRRPARPRVLDLRTPAPAVLRLVPVR